ncbi:hypothetical protein [Kutzneria buriramensis]|uniref:Uncharacterized protein n=1 Tax=Kutzneria buriramensis TaxID=1045776 RepID=A0A3E0I8C9_9PSEU|nr:hypothetical protein [Kutzneria buriramensis]REH55028.1 hypothetical protein BCF44_10144 [Kutzneria buriramensis]
MIPSDWVAHHREDDRELLGYLRPVDGGFEPVTVFGHPLGEAGDSDDAAAMLDAIGLSYLAERWLLTVPGRDEPIAVQVVEADPDHVRVKSVDHRYEGDAFLTLPVPVSGLQPQH